MRHKYCIIACIFLALHCSVAYASGDYGCAAPKGSIFLRGYNSCNSVPFLSPANDSRLNLQLLLIDAGKLTGSLNTSRDYPLPRDAASLRVPFDLEDWQVHEATSVGTQASSANSASDSNEYAQGEGSRCRNADDGIKPFRDAVKAAAIPSDDASILNAARNSLVADCNATSSVAWKPPAGLHSTLGREFAVYIAGAGAFYAGDFPEALKDFNSLKNSVDPWLKETSRYMVGRTLLNSAQRSAFGEWGDLQLSQVDKGNVREAEEAFNAYLHDFPHGTYAASARGLLRRVYWLSGDQTRLAEAYDKAFADPARGANNVTAQELVQEVDTKLLSSVEIERIKSPQLLAIIDLMRMRSANEQTGGPADKGALTLADLEAQKGRFAGNPALYDYLRAVLLYIEEKPEQTLALLPSMPGAQLSYFAFSQQTLRVLALEACHQSEKARQLVLQMLPLAKLPLQREQLELELAKIEERTGHLDRVFAPESPIRDKAIHTILVEHSASAELLRQRIKDPKENAEVVDAALYVLLYRELTRGKYQAFLSDLALVPHHPSEFLVPFVADEQKKDAVYQCPSLREVASTLQRQGEDAKSLNCVGELVRLQGVHYDQETTPPETDLGGGKSLFPGTNYSRLDGYLKVIGNDHAEADARSYALFRAIRCFAPSGYNDCGKQEIPLRTRKQWFQMLHKDYPDSSWAKSLKYYW
jgi:hypothetical protein